MAGRRTHAADLATVWAGVGLAAGAGAIAAVGPARSLPVAWGWDGVADEFSSRGSVVLMLALGALLTLIVGLVFGLAARTAARSTTARRLRLTQLTGVVAVCLTAGLGAAASLNGVVDLMRPAPLLAGAAAVAAAALLILRAAVASRA